MPSQIHIGILGGSFNPITSGHIQIAKFVLNNTDIDSVWLMPCYGHCLKTGLIDSLYRYDMCRLACLNEPNIKASYYEIVNKLDGSVFNLLNVLSKDPKMFQYDFSFIIGADNVVNFNQWRNAEELKKIVRFVTVPRQGTVIPNDITWHKNNPHIFLGEKNPVIEVSATEIRILLGKWWKEKLSSEEIKNLNGKMDAKVLKYIENHSLYKEQNEQGQ